MKFMVFALAFLTLAFICSLFAQAGEFSWKLADEKATLRDWEVISGDWTFKDGWWEVKSTEAQPGIAVVKEDVAKKLGLYTHDGMICEVTFEDFGDGGWQNQYIIFAYAPDVDKDHVFQAGQRVGQGNWAIERMGIPGRAARVEEHFLRVKGGTQGTDAVSPKKQYNFKLEIKGDTIITYNNNKEQIRFTIGKDKPEMAGLNQFKKMPVGRIGISNENAHGHFKNFKVSGPGVRAIEPAGKLATAWCSIKAQ
ncbi:MAG: hypothetical protein ACE5PV_21350 [Candidatus Poribacteria bacterium]